MFEAQLAYYLNRYLGTYVQNLDTKSLKVSVFKGDVTLRNLKLKPEALADLNLPITVKAGLLGSLTLKVGCLGSTVCSYDVQVRGDVHCGMCNLGAIWRPVLCDLHR